MRKIILIVIVLLSGMYSCDYLDIVPENTPVLDDAFKDENAAEKFVYSCYTNIPNYRNFRNHPSWCTTPEVVGTYAWIPGWFDFLKIQQGKYSADDPVIDFWTNCYVGIRQCYVFLDKIDGVNKTSGSAAELERKKTVWKAEVNFLIAYYHYILLQNYGPIVIADKMIDYNSSDENEVFRSRRPYDECVAKVEEMFNKAIANLPVTREQFEYGRPTKAIAKALIARMHLYAASPLFNGNTALYSNFKNKDGEQLISLQHDKAKWKTALDAIESAIKYAEEAGIKLYQSKLKSGTDKEKAIDANRYVMTEPWNEELIFGYSNNRESLDGNSFQRHAIPRGTGSTTMYGAFSVSLDVIKLFFTENGLPIEKDPDYDMNEIYKMVAEEGTIYLNTKREPRFYAWVGYDNGVYPCNNFMRLKLKCGETHGAALQDGKPDFSRDLIYSGYAIAKGVNPAATANSTQNSIIAYPFPLIRLAELYLAYAEAYVEYYGKLDGDALRYVNEVRARAGIPNIEVSYSKIGGLPGNQAELVDIVRREKTNEFILEGQMAYDYKRWMIAHKKWKGMVNGMLGLNAGGTTVEEFSKETRLVTQPFVFSSKQYLMPINQKVITKNKNLVQNPGWGADFLPELD